MIKIDVNYYFGSKQTSYPLELNLRNGKKVILHATENNGGRLNEALAKSAAEFAKDALITQEYSPAPLGANYLMWKSNKGFSLPIGFLNKSGNTMYNNITAFRSGDRRGWVFGVKERSGKHTYTYSTKKGTRTVTRPMTSVVQWFEFGTRKQPIRPFMRYGLDKMLRQTFDEISYNKLVVPLKRAFTDPSWWDDRMRAKDE
jgi:hypothetical protein